MLVKLDHETPNRTEHKKSSEPPASRVSFPCTPPKTNMELENEPLEQEILIIKNHHFQFPC